LNSSLADTDAGGQDGTTDRSSRGENEPNPEPRLGQAGAFGSSESGDDEPLDIDKIIARHDARIRLSKPRTLEAYRMLFKRFATASNLKTLTRAKLRTSLGKRLLVDFINSLPDKSRASACSGLKSYYENGIGLPWPIVNRRDFRRFQKASRRFTPLDEDVLQVAERYQLELDPYHKLIWELTSNYGWRPNHLTRLCWADIRRDSSGRPVSIVADGSERQFKTDAWIYAAAFPSVTQAILGPVAKLL